MPVPRVPSESQRSYATRILRMQVMYPVICFLPEDKGAYETGITTLKMFEAIPRPNLGIEIPSITTEKIAAMNQIREIAESAGLNWLLGDDSASVDNQPQAATEFDRLGVLNPGGPDASRISTEVSKILSEASSQSDHASAPPKMRALSLHQALGHYQSYLRKEHFMQDSGHVSPWGSTQIRQVKNLKSHHSDILLSQLDANAVNELVGYWRRRPSKLGSSQPMSAKSASNYLGTLMRFFNWLHTMDDFGWKKPVVFRDIDRRIRRLPIDHAKRSIEQVDTFSLDELRLLMRYGLPLDRLLLLLALNCGFGRAEIGSLLVGEVHLRKGHSPREIEILAFQTSSDDSFIKRIRRKSGVYGEHILFPLTVTGLEWAMERRRQFSECDPMLKLIVNEKGIALDQQTKGSNTSQAIPNQFARLIQRIQDDGHEIRKLSFGKLRKTASDLIKRHSSGEIAGVFDCHGEPVKSDSLSDVYTNRPFGKVFLAIRAVQDYLSPVFAEAGNNPFGPQPRIYTKRSAVERIRTLHGQGHTADSIAKEVGVSVSTVYRLLAKERQPDGEPSVK